MATTSPAAAVETARRWPTGGLLSCGIVGGPMFITVSLAQALLRDGYDLRRHHLSTLSLGDHGWVQITNFVVTGLLILGFAVGVRRVAGRALGVLLGLYGAGMIAGGVFVDDPVFGFPPGTPDGVPEVMSWHMMVHVSAAMTAFGALLVAMLVHAWRSVRRGAWGWAGYSVASGVGAMAPVLFTSPEAENGGGWLVIASLVTAAWVTSLAVRLRRSPAPVV